jgi:hypothetical protein
MICGIEDFVWKPRPIITSNESIIAYHKSKVNETKCEKCGRWTIIMQSFDNGKTDLCEHCVYKLMERQCPCWECHLERTQMELLLCDPDKVPKSETSDIFNKEEDDFYLDNVFGIV